MQLFRPLDVVSTSGSETLLDFSQTGMTVEKTNVFPDRVPWKEPLEATEVDAKALDFAAEVSLRLVVKAQNFRTVWLPRSRMGEDHHCKRLPISPYQSHLLQYVHVCRAKKRGYFV
jgi:hypothetical protein